MVKRIAIGLAFTAGGLFLLMVLVLPAAGVLTVYRAPTPSMEPAVKMNSRFAVLEMGYEPEIGDVAVFAAPASSQQGQQCRAEPDRGQMCATPDPDTADVKFIKRVVAGPGDEIAMRDGRLIRNGEPEPLSDYDLGECTEAHGCDFPNPMTVPEGHWFVLGDNRGASDDSRFWGPVPTEHFVGRRIFTYWPG